MRTRNDGFLNACIKLVLLFLAFMALCFAISLLAAQFVVFGLSIMHVNSGIWGPYWILSGVNMAIGTSSIATRSK